MRNKEAGFSLMEVTVVLAIVTVMMIMVFGLIEQTVRTTMFAESHNDLAVISQKAVNALQAEVIQTKMVFEENTLGSSYRGALNLPSIYPVWTDSLMPVIQPAVGIAPDTSPRHTGNSALLARQLAPLRITYNHDGNGATPEIEFVADRYVFEYIYLTSTSNPAFARSGRSLDLVMTTSVQYADYFQLVSLGSTAVSRIVPKLTAAGLARAWDPGQPLAQAFYALSGATDGTFDAPLGNPRIELGSAKSLLPGLRGGRISGKMTYSVGFVPTPPATPYPLRIPIRLFAPVVAGRPGFPSGFEIKISGPSGNRQVMTRVVLMSHYAAKSYESQQGFVTTAARF
ncbi:MAG TPA: prepilin-type N-terminal cleavage/methylation domain-containing protein [Thermoanaerobaculia bacterium]|nr:prepilin-type N-terminal cleavage/methylation domain-containing protein [Thermoanaerobaculia bacterium]